MIRFIEFLVERPKGVSIVIALLAAAVLLWSITVDTSHAHTWAEMKIPGFWSLFGLVSCIILIFFAYWLSRAGISKEEDYYDN